MRVDQQNYRTIWLDPDDDTKVYVIDQRQLPHRFLIARLSTVEDMYATCKFVARL